MPVVVSNGTVIVTEYLFVVLVLEAEMFALDSPIPGGTDKIFLIYHGAPLSILSQSKALPIVFLLDSIVVPSQLQSSQSMHAP